jgi:hypothetical protein
LLYYFVLYYVAVVISRVGYWLIGLGRIQHVFEAGGSLCSRVFESLNSVIPCVFKGQAQETQIFRGDGNRLEIFTHSYVFILNASVIHHFPMVTENSPNFDKMLTLYSNRARSLVILILDGITYDPARVRILAFIPQSPKRTPDRNDHRASSPFKHHRRRHLKPSSSPPPPPSLWHGRPQQA